MKRLFVLFIILSLLMSACSTIKPNITDSSGDVESDTTETQSGATDSTNETTATTEGSEETGSAETTQGTENADGTGAATTPNTGNSDPTQGSTKPTTGSTEPTQGTINTPPTTGTTDPTEGGATKPTTGTTPTEPTTQPTTPTTQPTTQPTTPPATASLKINTKNNATVAIGSTLQLDYTYTGNKSLTWTSNNTSAVTVDKNGKVTGVAYGYSLVKVTDGELIARITIVVEEALATSLVEMSHNAPLYDGVTKYAGDYMTFQVYAMPEEANRLVTVTSSNSSVISVSYNADSRNITQVTLNFKSAGTATVTIKSADGNKSKAYSITVKGGYACNPGSGTLTPEQFVNCFNGIVEANGMTNEYVPSGYLVLTLSASELTWSRVRREAEAEFHHWYEVFTAGGYSLCLVLTYEGTNANGSHIFYVHR